MVSKQVWSLRPKTGRPLMTGSAVHTYICKSPKWEQTPVSWLGLTVRRLAGKRKDPGSTPHFGSPFSEKMVVWGHCFATLPHTISIKHSNGWHHCSSKCGNHYGGDSVALDRYIKRGHESAPTKGREMTGSNCTFRRARSSTWCAFNS